MADYLNSPLNHNEGQDGPDDFDRPLTVAAHSATLAAFTWGVDFAITGIRQIFEALDLKYETEGEAPEQLLQAAQHEGQFVRRIVATVVDASQIAQPNFPREVLTSIQS